MFDCVGLVNHGGSPVSSTRIRAAISEGNIADANIMLGREFSYKTEVVDGKKRGRLLDAPTINQYFEPGFIIPKAGVYASVTTVDGREYPSVTNIGLRPTFENEDFRSETYIIGFEGNLYGRFIEVKLIKYLREEIRFSSEQALKDQIAADAGESVAVFGKRGADIV
jgi:riboflavin kinase/FMN adenylyltransferase